ncbi:MAG: hypothetical protein GKS02_03165 [Alphaproteobacteria bacterium]|nr:hypothetical protein [Alphaproteobacteria bacterium]
MRRRGGRHCAHLSWPPDPERSGQRSGARRRRPHHPPLSEAPNRAGRPRWQRWLTLAAGWLFILLGLVGLFLPFLQGILFLVVGVLLLARESEWVRRVLLRLRRRYPGLAAKFTAVSHKARQFIGRFRRGR